MPGSESCVFPLALGELNLTPGYRTYTVSVQWQPFLPLSPLSPDASAHDQYPGRNNWNNFNRDQTLHIFPESSANRRNQTLAPTPIELKNQFTASALHNEPRRFSVFDATTTKKKAYTLFYGGPFPGPDS